MKLYKSGQSGNVTTPQLHFELRRGGRAVDPRGQLPRESAAAE
jgi:murein DD-endopeptidase MepM/ murein hydrolase activator NlpD